jgi:hypothetical protein
MAGSTEKFTTTMELYVFQREKPDPTRIPIQFENQPRR